MQISNYIKLENGKAYFGDLNQYNDVGVNTIKQPLSKILARIFGTAILCEDAAGNSAVKKKSELKKWLKVHRQDDNKILSSKIDTAANASASFFRLQTLQRNFFSEDNFTLHCLSFLTVIEFNKSGIDFYNLLNEEQKKTFKDYINVDNAYLTTKLSNIQSELKKVHDKSKITFLNNEIAKIQDKQNAYKTFLIKNP